MHISGQSIVRQQKRSLTNRRQRSVVPAPIALRTDSHLLENDAVLALRRGLPARAGTGVAGARLRAGLRPRSPDNPGTIPSGRRAPFPHRRWPPARALEVEKRVGPHPETKMVGNMPYTPRVKQVMNIIHQRTTKRLRHVIVGNKVNGVIALNRPIGTEAAAGQTLLRDPDPLPTHHKEALCWEISSLSPKLTTRRKAPRFLLHR